MSIVIAIITLLCYILIATSPFSNVNKSAVAMFAGTVGWVLYVAFGSDFVEAEHMSDYIAYLSGATTNSVVVKEYIASNIFIKYVGKASEIVLFLISTMAIVEILNNNGCFDFFLKWFRTRSSRRMLWGMAAMTFFLSAHLDNLTVTTMMLVVMHKLLPNRRQRAVFGAVILLSANAGGAMTVIGDNTGLLLWNMKAVTPSHFTAWMAAPCLSAWLITTYLMSRLLPERVELERVSLPYRGDDTNLTVWQRIFMLCFALAGLWFIPTFHSITKLSPFLGALCVLSLLWIVNEAFNYRLMHANRVAEMRTPMSLQYGVMQMILFVMGVMLMMGVMVETSAGTWFGHWMYGLLGNVWTMFVAPMVAGFVSLCLDSFASSTLFFSLYNNNVLAEVAQNGEYWVLIAYTTAMGGTILGIGSLSGLALFRIGDVKLEWYLRKFTPRVLLGAFIGLAILIAEIMLF